MERRRAAGAVLVGYSPSATGTARFARMLIDELQVRGIRIRDGIRTDGSRWWPILDERGLPDDGVAYEVSNHPLVSSAVYQGRVALPDENALRESLRPVSGAARVRARSTTERVRARFGQRHPDVPDWPNGPVTAVQPVVDAGARFAVGVVRRLLADRDAIPEEHEVAWLGIYLLHLSVRDEVWALMTKSTAAKHVAIWRDIARRCDQELMVAPFTLLGFAAWLDGEGVLARYAIGTALDTEPDYTMAKLVSELLATATPPSRWKPHPLTRTR